MCFDIVCNNQQRAKKTKQHDDDHTKVLTWTYIRFTLHEFLLFSSNTHSWVTARSILVCVEHKQPNHQPVLNAVAMTWCYLELVASMKNSASLLTRLTVMMISLTHFWKQKWGTPLSTVTSRIQWFRNYTNFNQDAWIRHCDHILLRDALLPCQRCINVASLLMELPEHSEIAESQFSGYDFKKKKKIEAFVCGVLTEVQQLIS